MGHGEVSWEEEERDDVPACPYGGSIVSFVSIFQEADETSVIDLLFVHPDHGRRGAGVELVSRFCAIADEKGLHSIVEASPQGKRTYEKCGFVSHEAVTILSDRWRGRDDNLYYWMERKASGS